MGYSVHIDFSFYAPVLTHSRYTVELFAKVVITDKTSVRLNRTGKSLLYRHLSESGRGRKLAAGLMDPGDGVSGPLRECDGNANCIPVFFVCSRLSLYLNVKNHNHILVITSGIKAFRVLT